MQVSFSKQLEVSDPKTESRSQVDSCNSLANEKARGKPYLNCYAVSVPENLVPSICEVLAPN